MNSHLDLNYIRDFADLCESIQSHEIEELAPRIIETIPQIISYKYDELSFIEINDATNLLKDKCFESAIIKIIPKNTKISLSFCEVMTCTFADRESRIPLKTYFSRSKSYALGLLSCYLRFLSDQFELTDLFRGDSRSAKLRLVKP